MEMLSLTFVPRVILKLHSNHPITNLVLLLP